MSTFANNMEQREWLKDYFTYTWPSSRTAGFDRYYWTGFRLIEEIKDDEHVLDVGCGVNPLKRHVKNLVGLDITDIGSDIQCAIEDFTTKKKFDVALCLGSLNFGDHRLIDQQIKHVSMALKGFDARVYWRCNPGHRDHGNNRVEEVPFYNWNLDKHVYFSKKYGFEITEFMPDLNRMYVKWER